MLFIDVVRRYLVALPPEHAGWLAGLRDPLIGKVISMMHARPAHDWTIDELAREAGMSRTVLAERFAKLVGIPPMHYLAKWRMQVASELLTSGKTSLSSIAAAVWLRVGGVLQPCIQEVGRRASFDLAAAGATGGVECRIRSLRE